MGIALTQTETSRDVSITITSPATANEDVLGMVEKDIEDAEEFAVNADAVPLGISDFDVTVHERKVGMVTDTVTVYDNEAAPKSVPYMTYFSDDNTIAANGPDGRPAIVTNVTDLIDATMEASDNITVDGTPVQNDSGDKKYDTGDGILDLGTAVGMQYKLFYADAFKLPPTTTKMYAGADDPQTPDMKENEFAGTFSGVEGVYVCGGEATMCTATTDAKGNLSLLSDNWTFRPTADAARGRVAGVDHDTDYLSFGYWLQATEKS